jgi:transcriptional regulator with XRE-family HTH domain
MTAAEHYQPKALGAAIRAWRQARSRGLRDTAADAGISPTTLSRIETGDFTSPPSEAVIRRIAAALHTPEQVDEWIRLAGRVPADLHAAIVAAPGNADRCRKALQGGEP